MSEELAVAATELARRQEAFRKDLADLLNRHSMENGSNTPDFLLADHLIDCLRGLDSAINRRERWYGRGIVVNVTLAGINAAVIPESTKEK